MTGDGRAEVTSAPVLLDQIFRAIATLEVALGKVATNQESLKAEVKTIVPRLDGIGARLDTLTAEVGQLAERIHRTNNLAQIAIDEAERVRDEHGALDRAIDKFETATTDRANRLERSQDLIEKMIDVLDTRVGRLRDAIADIPADEPTRKETP